MGAGWILGTKDSPVVDWRLPMTMKKKCQKTNGPTLAEARAALARLRVDAQKSGLDKMTAAEIDEEIAAVRREMQASAKDKARKPSPAKTRAK